MSKDNKKFFESKNSWSVIKDKLLGSYLVPYFQKILATGKPVLYIDCFAGKGKFDDGEKGSPLIAIDARKSCLENTYYKSDNSSIEMIFLEPKHYKILSENVAECSPDNEFLNVIKGKYEDCILNILSDKSGYNIFLYIDPYGIKALDYSIFENMNKIGLSTIEMLINCNSFGFFRNACRVMKVNISNDEAFQNLDDLVEYEPTVLTEGERAEELLNKIAGGDYWKDIVVKYNNGEINGYQAEKMLSEAYKKVLKQNFKYVLDMPIRLKVGQRPKYRMIHVSNHESGCYLMVENILKRKDELYFNIQLCGQGDLFCDDTMSRTVEDDMLTIEEIKDRVVSHLNNYFNVGLMKFIADFYSENGVISDIGVIKETLKALENNGTLEVRRCPSNTKTGRKSCFWDEGKGKRVILRYLR